MTIIMVSHELKYPGLDLSNCKMLTLTFLCGLICTFTGERLHLYYSSLVLVSIIRGPTFRMHARHIILL